MIQATRPIYETKADREREARALEDACKRWEVEFIKLPELACADAICHRHGLAKALVDVKVRFNEFGKYDDYKVSLLKVDNIRLSASLLKLKPFLIVKFTDCLTYVDLLQPNDIDPNWGRKDRNDPKDMEAAAIFEWDQFRKFQ